MTYSQALTLIRAALSQRPSGTKVQVTAHEAAEIAILDYAAGITTPLTYRPSPFAGSGNQQQQSAIKYMAVSELSAYDLLYVSEMYASKTVGSLVTGKWSYRIAIYNAITPVSDPVSDVPWLEYSLDSDTQLTGATACPLSESDGSGTSGTMVVDWSKLTEGQYINNGYLEGCLFGVPQFRSYSSKGGEGIEVLPVVKDYEITTDGVINGSVPLYVATGSAEITATICAIDDVVLDSFVMKNEIVGHNLIVKDIEALGIGGFTEGVEIATGKSVTIYPRSTKFEITGDYTEHTDPI